VSIVLDTNVLFAALISRGLCREVFQRVVRQGQLASSSGLLDELEEVVECKLEATPDVKRFLRDLRHHAHLVKPATLPGPICRDPDDDLVLATAMAAQARFLVTGDDDLLVLRTHEGIPILSPRQFLEAVDS
jgi:putative PIN family toxin of toxin-antitoxin system